MVNKALAILVGGSPDSWGGRIVPNIPPTISAINDAKRLVALWWAAYQESDDYFPSESELWDRKVREIQNNRIKPGHHPAFL